MHELSVVQSIWKILDEELAKAGGRTLLRVKIVIGDLSGVVPEALDFYLKLLAEERGQDKATFEYVRVPVKFRCSDCGHTFTVDRPMFSCPKCGSTAVKMVSGTEFYIEEIEVE